MMAKRLQLPDFGARHRVQPAAESGQQDHAAPDDPARLETYETGYSAGWEDAMQNAAEDRARIAAGLAAQLQEISFSFNEAKAHVLANLAPLIEDLVGRVLPQAAAAGLPSLVAEIVGRAAHEATDAPLLLAVSEADHDRILPLLPETPGLPLRIDVLDTLAEGQVQFTIGEHKTEIDHSGALQEMDAAIRDFFAIETSEERLRRHG